MYDDFEGEHHQSTGSFSSPLRRSSTLVKVDAFKKDETEPSLNERDMLRIFDARNDDIGQGRIIKKDCTPDKLALMLREFCETTGAEPGQVFKHNSTLSGGSQRFREYCSKYCINRRLVLKGFALGFESAKEIASILAVKSEIAHLNICKNNIRDKGVDVLMQVVRYNQNLIHLDLTQNNITSIGAKKVFKNLTGNNSIISLNLGNIENINKNKVGLKAIPSLNEYLKASTVLTFLNLRSTLLTDQGLALLCEGLKDNKTLLVLNIAKNDITADGMEPFAETLPTT